MKNILLIVFCLILSSCSMAIPEHDLVILPEKNINVLLSEIEEYNTTIMEKALIQSNIKFQFMGRTLNALGLTSIDEKNNTYRVAALNPMGVTLFQINVENDEVISSYIIPQFTPGSKKNDQNAEKVDKTAEMISKDISYVYFNRKVSKNPDNIKHKKYTLEIRVNDQDRDYFIYKFTGSPLRLAAKTKFSNTEKLWSVDYYDYRVVNNKEMPFKIILQNHKYGYRLDINTKKVSHLK